MSSGSLLTVSVSLCGSSSPAGVECASVSSFSSSTVSLSSVGASCLSVSSRESADKCSEGLAGLLETGGSSTCSGVLELEFLLFSGSSVCLVPEELSFSAGSSVVLLSFLGGSDSVSGATFSLPLLLPLFFLPLPLLFFVGEYPYH